MKNRDFEAKLRQTLHQTAEMPNPHHLEQTCLLANGEVLRKNKRERISFMQLICKQIRFVGWKVWGAQGLLLLYVSSMMGSVYGRYFWESPQSIVKILFCLSVLVAISALPFMYRVIRYRMQEIEGAAYFSAARLLMAKLMVIGIGDLLLLGGIFAVTLFKTPLQAGHASLYLCMPFLFVTSASLFMLGHLPAKDFFTGSAGLGVLLIGIVILLPEPLYVLLRQSFSMGWLVVCGILLAFCIGQCRRILHHCPYAEQQIVM